MGSLDPRRSNSLALLRVSTCSLVEKFLSLNEMHLTRGCDELPRARRAYFAFGNLIYWKSKLQPLTAGSTHEAELIALSYASEEGVWLSEPVAKKDEAGSEKA